jgi:creatinine amidohydrolase
MSQTLEWAHLTGKQLATLDPARHAVIVTCSPLEVHGPHLPVIADLGESEGLFASTLAHVGQRLPDLDFLKLPPVFAAADVVPQRGSLRFRPSTVTRVLVDLGRTLLRQGFRDVWVGNFHGGPRHILAIERAAAIVQREGSRMISLFSLMLRRLTGGSSDLSDFLGGIGGISAEELRGDSHGGLIETALLLHLYGKHVDGKYDALPPRSLEILLKEQGKKPLQKGARPTVFELIRALPYKARYYESETYAGAPAKATAELGRQYLERLSQAAAEALVDLREGRLAPKDCHSPLWPMRHLFLNPVVGWIFDRLIPERPDAI